MAIIEVHQNQLEYYGHALDVRTVLIDGRLVSESFQLFDASTEIVASHICLECYAASNGEIATCGHADIAVRKHAGMIYWFVVDHECASPLIPNVPLNHVWSFPLANYESQLKGSTYGLPDFNVTDIESILNRAAYPPELGLYTIPFIDADPHGRRLLDIIAQSITSHDLAICPTPEHYRTIRVGIETDKIPETVVDVGVVERRYAMRFVAQPSFPLWLTSDEIHRYAASFLA